MAETKTTHNEDGKVITETVHDDGRVDVTIGVPSLDVDMSDPGTVAAKKVIEEKILPKVLDRKVTCTLIHKPTNDHFSFVTALKHVRVNAEVAMQRHSQVIGRIDPVADYCIVQNDGEGHITVTSL